MIIKKFNRKTATTFVLALLLCLTVFLSACNSGNPSNGSNPNNEPTASPETNVTPEPQNLGTFTVVIPDNGKYSIATENDLVKQKIIDSIVKDKGIQINMNVLPLDSSDYIGQINSVLSSGQSIDCIVDDYSKFDMYMGIEGLCLPIDNYLVEYGQNLLNSLGSQYWDAVTYNDMVYAVPGASLEETSALYVRQDMLDRMGLFSIETRDEFNAALIAFSTLSGSGITPLAINYEQALDYMTYFTGAPSSDYLYISGKYIMREQHRYFPEFLDMLKNYYEKGYIPQDFFDITQEQTTAMFTNSLAMMYIADYTDVADDYKELITNQPNAQMELVTKPTHRRMAYVELTAETPVSEVCIFTSYGQNQSALMVYLDWLLTDVENYETANLGILGTHINFNNISHEYQLLGEYDQQTDFYNSIFGLGISHEAVYSPVVPLNGDTTIKTCLELAFKSYEHLSTATVIDEGSYELSPEAQNALAYYRFSMDEAVRRYVTGEITYSEYRQYQVNNEVNSDIILNELSTMQPNGDRQ